MAMVQNQWYHVGIGAPPILVYLVGIGMFTGGTGFLTHGHIVFRASPFGKSSPVIVGIRGGMMRLAWSSKTTHDGEHPNPTTKIGSKMGGEFTYPKMGSHWF